MKRKIAKVLVAGLVGLQLIGCSNQKAENAEDNKAATDIAADTESTMIYFDEINAEEYVTLGEYKGLEIVNTTQAISDEEVDSYIDYMLAATGGELEEITDRDVIEYGDVANIDYVGKKDGVAFDGGSDEGYDLTIGSGSFIPGFEEEMSQSL